jgi:hypothetical protein
MQHLVHLRCNPLFPCTRGSQATPLYAERDQRGGCEYSSLAPVPFGLHLVPLALPSLEGQDARGKHREVKRGSRAAPLDAERGRPLYRGRGGGHRTPCMSISLTQRGTPGASKMQEGKRGWPSNPLHKGRVTQRVSGIFIKKLHTELCVYIPSYASFFL